ncbi:MAG: T6SS immunity protein Tdi1 domain-containing protein [Albidovulum sp.]
MELVAEINQSWGWIGLDAVEVVGQNAFGNLLIKDKAGAYWRLCPEELSCELVASSNEELAELLADCEFLLDWDMEELITAARLKVGLLDHGQVYCFVPPPVLSGSYDDQNIVTIPLRELVRLSGDIAAQIRDLPDGTIIELDVID